MSEQSDTPETDTAEREDAGPITHAMRGWNYARKHERERDEARAALRMIADGDLYNADGMRTIACKALAATEVKP